jgi:5-methyltetrahydrofolate--homocysteine methyltransferase
MTIENLNIIGERINPGFKSTKLLFDNQDVAGIQQLAVDQVSKGASYLNINIGDLALKKPEFMVAVIKAVQEVVSVPLSFDFPNAEVQELCLRTYDPGKANGALPIVNSISELRWEMLELLKICPCRFILMASEREEGGQRIANKTAEEVYQTAARMTRKILSSGYGLTTDDLFVDVSIGPIGADMEGLTRMAVESIHKIGSDPELKGIHMSVGLSNSSIMLPKEAGDGSLLKPQIESAFLTLTVPYGLDTVLGTAGRDYNLLPEDNLVMRGVREAIGLDGIDAILRIQQIYQAA